MPVGYSLYGGSRSDIILTFRYESSSVTLGKTEQPPIIGGLPAGWINQPPNNQRLIHFEAKRQEARRQKLRSTSGLLLWKSPLDGDSHKAKKAGGIVPFGALRGQASVAFSPVQRVCIGAPKWQRLIRATRRCTSRLTPSRTGPRCGSITAPHQPPPQACQEVGSLAPASRRGLSVADLFLRPRAIMQKRTEPDDGLFIVHRISGREGRYRFE